MAGGGGKNLRAVGVALEVKPGRAPASATKAQGPDQGLIASLVGGLEVIEQRTALRHHH
jgi:hypothetical protein